MCSDAMTYDPRDNATKCYELAIEEKRKKLESFPCVQIGDAMLYQGDCLELLPLLPKVDAVVTDPPYGISYSPAAGGRGCAAKTFTGSDLVYGDKEPFDPSAIIGIAPEMIIWGANHFANRLPASSCWLVWDKREGQVQNDFADCEIAWTSLDKPARVINHLWNGALRKSEHGQTRVHPTQKAIAVMEWCLKQVQGAAILDPFMGSGTTGVACAKLGRKFIGIEIEPKYFDIACKRIKEAYAQPDMFVESPAKAEQLAMHDLTEPQE